MDEFEEWEVGRSSENFLDGKVLSLCAKYLMNVLNQKRSTMTPMVLFTKQAANPSESDHLRMQ